LKKKCVVEAVAVMETSAAREQHKGKGEVAAARSAGNQKNL
jgi:hypothetical protein